MDIKYTRDLELDGYFKVLIKSGTVSYEYLNMFIMNMCVNIDDINSIIIDSNTIVKLNKVIKHYYKLPISHIDFIYKGIECMCYQVSKGTTATRTTQNKFDLSYDLLLFINDGNKVLVDELLIDSRVWYDKHILNKDKAYDDIICYNWTWGAWSNEG